MLVPAACSAEPPSSKQPLSFIFISAGRFRLSELSVSISVPQPQLAPLATCTCALALVSYMPAIISLSFSASQ